MPKEQILIIDNSGEVTDTVTTILIADGYEILSAADGDEGRRVYDEAHPELLIIDLNLVIENDYSFLDHISSPALNAMPIIVLTGDNHIEKITGCFKKGVNFFIKKPVSDMELRGMVRHIVNLKQGRDQSFRKGGKSRQIDEFRHTLEKAIETMSLGYTISGVDGTILHINKIGAKMHGYSPEELIGKNVKVLSHKKALTQSKGGKKVGLDNWDKDSVNIRKDGSTFPVLTKSMIDMDDITKPIRIFTSYEDIGERKLMEEKLSEYNDHLEEMVKRRTADLEKAKEAAERASKTKSDFLSTVSHELRTPLTSIRGFSTIVKNDLQERIFPNLKEQNKKTMRNVKNLTESLEIMEDESEKLTFLISDILDMAKMESGDVEWKEELVDLRELSEIAISSIEEQLEQKGLLVNKEISDEDVKVIGDRERLIQLMSNLLHNAVKFSEQGAITCRIKKESENIRCEVEDEGCGIPDHLRDEIFERFKQVDDILTDKPQGTGLGLTICKEIVEHYKGKLWVESEVGKGSRFIFTIPVDFRKLNVYYNECM